MRECAEFLAELHNLNLTTGMLEHHITGKEEQSLLQESDLDRFRGVPCQVIMAGHINTAEYDRSFLMTAVNEIVNSQK